LLSYPPSLPDALPISASTPPSVPSGLLRLLPDGGTSLSVHGVRRQRPSVPVCNDAGGDEKAVPVSRRTVCLGSHSPPTAAWPYHWKASTSLSSSSSWRWHSLLSPWPGCWYVRSSPHSKAQSECATSQSQFKKELGPTSNGSSAPL